MGLYPVACVKCGQQFMWFSGNQVQVCEPCRVEMTKAKKASDTVRAAAALIEAMGMLAECVAGAGGRVPEVPVKEFQSLANKLRAE